MAKGLTYKHSAAATRTRARTNLALGRPARNNQANNVLRGQRLATLTVGTCLHSAAAPRVVLYNNIAVTVGGWPIRHRGT